MLCICDHYIEILVVVEYAGVEYFIFRIDARALPVLFLQFFIWKFLLRVFVQVFHIIMGGNIVEIIIQFFYIFAMIAFAIAQAE